MSDKTVLETILSLPSLRCDTCKGYISSSPVRSLPNGNCICGCCPAPDGNIQVHRVLLLEAILSQMSFPCKFSDNGCTIMIPFGQTAQHEDKCTFQSHVSPVNLKACLSKGPAMEKRCPIQTAGHRPPYTLEEEKKIVRYIIENKLFHSLRGNECWKTMEADGVVERSWQSLKEHFRKRIFYMLAAPELGITAEERKSINDGYNATRLQQPRSANTSRSPTKTSESADLSDVIFVSSDDEI